MSNFFMIVGAQKCATTSMHNWLDQHPDICMSNPKEPQFFEREYWRGADWYVNECYPQWDSRMKLYGEARVHNLLIKYVPARIAEYNPNTKIIIMIRNPVDRFISAWNHFRVMRPGREIRTLEQAYFDSVQDYDDCLFSSEESYVTQLDPAGGPYNCGYLEVGFYEDHIRRFSERFDTHVVILEDLKEKPYQNYKKVLNFLGANTYCPEVNILNSKEYESEYPVERTMLKATYKASVVRLSEYLGIDLLTKWDMK